MGTCACLGISIEFDENNKISLLNEEVVFSSSRAGLESITFDLSIRNIWLFDRVL